MPAPLVNISVAQSLFSSGQPFRIRLEYVGENYENKSGHSSKWWELSYSGNGNVIECNHGATGARGRAEPFRYNWWKALDKFHEKYNKGYRYISGTMTTAPAPTAIHAPQLIKLTGPFTEIREIRRIGAGLYKAFDKVGNYILDLDEDGRDQLLAADPMISLS